jgi:hypothetical protein
MSNTACANIRSKDDLEINAIPDIKMATALNINNVCLICRFFHIMLYVNERIANVLKYPLKTRENGKNLKKSINKSVPNVILSNMEKMCRNLKI